MLALMAGCKPEKAEQERTIPLRLSTSVEAVISGYQGNIMEPFLSRDGKILLFNNLNSQPENTNLHWATRINDSSFQYEGEIEGVNTSELEGVPSLDLSGNLFLVSTRNYASSLSTLFTGKFTDGKVTGVELLETISRHQPGIVNFDAEVSASGQTLYFVDGLFGPAAELKTADLVYARQTNQVFRRAGDSRDIFKEINTDDLEYAPCISSDELTLFFTRIQLPFTTASVPEIWVSTRRNIQSPFSIPSKLTDITGFAEAIAIAPDQRTLYYHKRVEGRFRLYMTRIIP